jgi:hypothetical protein
MQSISITVTPKSGKTIQEVCGDVKELSELLKEEITFNFNGILLTAHDNISINEMVQNYSTCK